MAKRSNGFKTCIVILSHINYINALHYFKRDWYYIPIKLGCTENIL